MRRVLDETRTDSVYPDGLTKLFAEIRHKQTVQDLSPQYQKFAEWLRIEYVYTWCFFFFFFFCGM